MLKQLLLTTSNKAKPSLSKFSYSSSNIWLRIKLKDYNCKYEDTLYIKLNSNSIHCDNGSTIC